MAIESVQHSDFRFLLAAARTEPALEQLRALAGHGGSEFWERLFRLATYHRVHLLVFRALKQTGIDMPGDVRERFEETTRAARVWNRFGLDELDRILKLFKDHGIPAMSFKGPVLGHQAYGQLGLRYSLDLDLLVRRQDMSRIDEMLREKGYRRLNPDRSALRRQIRFYFEKEHHYSKGELTYNFDIHTEAVKPGLGPWLSFNALHERGQHVHIGDRSFVTPSVEDLLRLLCYHGAKDRWARLRRICDINELTRRHPGLDWEAVLTCARVERCERILGLGLYITHKVLKLSLPGPVKEFVNQHPSMMEWGDRLSARLPRRMYESAWGSLRERVEYPLAIQDTLAGKVRYATYAGLGKLAGRFT